LNTVVPFSFDDYYRQRSTLAIGKDETLKLNDEIGFHPGLAKLKGLYDNGRVAVVQGVGYPNPNRSHFRSMEIWETASDANQRQVHGWIGRYFDNTCAGCAEQNPMLAVNIGRMPPQSFRSKQPMGIAVDDPNALEWKPPTRDAMEAKEAKKLHGDLDTPLVGRVTSRGDSASAESGDSAYNGAPGGRALPTDPLDFLRRTSLNAQLASDKIKDAVAKYKGGVEYPDTRFARRLQLIAQMIAGQLPTRVYYASIGGFDTHANQKQERAELLAELADALDAFCRDLKAQGNDGRVVIMTFSEFGRRVAENASGGTDHGTAAPMFVIGAPVKGGIYGGHPRLNELDRGDLKMHTDFRNVYATVLENWLGAKARPILGRDFPRLDLLAA
jgi:uncharacterized protein (DUF1501 family)